MKIILATGIFPPTLGGPAAIALAIKDKLVARGYRVEVLTFSEYFSVIGQQGGSDFIHCLQRTNAVSNYLRYFFQLKKLVKKEDLVLAFDAFSVGLPAVLVKRIRGNKLAIRLGGDFLWEQSIAKGLTNVPLTEFYRQKFNRWQKLRFKLIGWALKTADKIILTNQWFFDIIKEPYNLREEWVEIIGNYYPEQATEEEARNKTVLAAGRFIKLKNFEKLIKVFNGLEAPGAKLAIYGEGPLKKELKTLAENSRNNRVEIRAAISQTELLKELARCRFYIQASFSEVSPNTVLQALAASTPVLLTKYCGFEFLKGKVAMFDPFDAADLKSKLELFYDESFYAKQQASLKAVDRSYNLAKAAAAYEKSLLSL